MKFSDLDIDIPSTLSDRFRVNLTRATVTTKNGIQPHPAGIYFYKSIPEFERLAVLDYNEMENNNYQKIDILNNTYLDNISNDEMINFISLIENGSIDWTLLYQFEEPYQLSNYPYILREFKVKSVMDIAIVLAIIRPGSINKYDNLKKAIHTNKILDMKKGEDYDILKDTYGIPIFDEQYKKMNIDDGKYRYKKPHAVGYAYVLLLDFLKKTSKQV